jgi:ferredoxin/nitrate reductase gamma subunit
MAVTVNPSLLRDIKRHGAFDVSACFHCGNCTAVCPLSDEAGNFPRRMIRLGQIGDRERLLDSPETWLCYYCGECSDTCPREAEPGEYMAAIRRYAIAAAEPTGIGRWMYGSALGLIIITALFGAVLGALLVGVRGSSEVKHVLFGLVPYGTVHNVGVGVGILTVLSMAISVMRVLRRFLKGVGKLPVSTYVAAVRSTVAELATMKRHRDETPVAGEPWYRNAASVHLAIMWGFVALFVATALDYIFITLLPLGITTFWPARIIGTIGGVVMMAGVTAAIVRRLQKVEKNVARTDPMDWWLLWVLWILGITGFWLEIAVTLRASNLMNDLVLLVHAALAMELILLVTFTKFAHVIYRPIALFAYFVRKGQAA